MSAQVAGLKAVDQGLSLTKSIADVTAAALVSIKASLERIQDDVVAAGQSGTSQSAVQSDIVAQQQSILAIANSASFNGVNWLINKTSTDTTVTIDGTSSVSEADLEAIALGQESAGAQSVYDSTLTTTTTLTENGSSASTTSTSGETVTKTDNGDGTVTVSPAVTHPATSSSSGDPGVDRAVVPMSVSASGGLVTSSFSLVPLALFSDGANTYTSTTSISYAGGPPVTVNSVSSSAVIPSYEIGGSGILDGTLLLTRPVPGNASSSSPQPSAQPSTPEYYFDPITGGDVEQTSSGSGSGSSPTTETIQESILTLSVVGTSASDLAEMGAAVQAAIAGIITASTAVGSLQTQISTQQTFNASLSDALTSGIGSLLDADMNVASTRLQALQTQQQLGIQALSVANNNNSLILKLFQAA